MLIQIKKLLSLVLVLNAFLFAQAATSLSDIKTSLICTCECNMTVAACEGSMSCGTSAKLTREAKELMKKGLSKAQILDVFVARYGEQVLSAPTKEGFNLIAWILPFITLIVVGLGIIVLLRRWTNRSESKSVRSGGDTSATGDTKYEKQLDDILHKLDE